MIEINRNNEILVITFTSRNIESDSFAALVPTLNAIVGRNEKIEIAICLREEELANRKIAWFQSEIFIGETAFISLRLKNNYASIFKTKSYSLQILSYVKTLAISHLNVSAHWQHKPWAFKH